MVLWQLKFLLPVYTVKCRRNIEARGLKKVAKIDADLREEYRYRNHL